MNFDRQTPLLRAKLAVLAAAAFAAMAGSVSAQQEDVVQFKGNSLYRAKNVMSGNLVRTTFYNYGLVGNIGEISGEWPIGTGNEYVGDVSPLIGVELVLPSGDTLHAVTTTDGPRGSRDGPSGGGAFWGLEPLRGFAAPPAVGEDPKVAMSNQPETWPDRWPDKLYTDSLDRNWRRDDTDPGWPGKWNGYFGKGVFNADQETYFQMDDNADMEWFRRQGSDGNFYYLYPASYDTTRRGLGLRVTVRGLQWAHFLAQDCIFWLYEITNISTRVYDKVTFGMMVGTLSGGRQDSQDDLAYFDLENDITYSFDSDDQGSPGWVPVRPGEINVGYVGYAFLESPGNPYDGIDNDGDGEAFGGPVLTGLDFAPRAIQVGDPYVMIDYDTYERSVHTMNASGTSFTVRGRTYTVTPGQMLVEDGRNGVDDNLNGLIDEREGDHLGLRYKNFITGEGLGNPMIDESRDDGIDNDGDWNPLTDDVGADGVPATGDVGEADGRPTNGEPHFDKTDIDESDQIGLNAFDYFSPPSAIAMNNDERLWGAMAPGRFDVVSGVPQDGDFIYGSGYFPLRPGQTERFSMALLYGEDLADITDNKITVQQVYNENYNFARPPDKPTLWAVPGDGKVTLYWDDTAERSFDPVCDCYDFEGYKIYRATDPSFNEVFSITDGMGRRVFHRPIAQYDLDNGNAGFFPVIRNAVIYYLGNDTGLQHTWTDTTVENGQTYYYAVVAYDRGDIEREILPAENSKTIVVDPSGNVTLDINTARVTPRAPAAGYEPPLISTVHHTGSATGTVGIEVVDPGRIQDNTRYEFTFTEEVDPSTPQTVNYSVIRHLPASSEVIIENRPLIPDDHLINQADRFAAYYDSLFNLPPGTFDPPRFFRVAATEVYDGQRAYLLVPRQVIPIEEVSGWANEVTDRYEYVFSVTNYPGPGGVYLTGRRHDADYQVEWYPDVVDTAIALNYYNFIVMPETPVNFRVKNLNRDEYIDFNFAEKDTTRNGIIDHNEVIIFRERIPELGDSLAVTWSIQFTRRPATGNIERPMAGDVLRFRLYQGFSSADRFEYSTQSARINPAVVDLSRIRVYPNPYVSANPQEPTNPFNEGRGERRITFIHLPDRCTIRIYNVRGELVDTIERNAQINDGAENWDLRSRDGLNVAYGIYLYHVESPYGEMTGRFAVIK